VAGLPQDAHGDLGAGLGVDLSLMVPEKRLSSWGVIVLQADLQLHSLQELVAFVLVPIQDSLHHFLQGVTGDFAAHGGNRKRAN
jgi:hypothetical protein